MSERRRAQLVLLAAAVVALALVPVVAAYLQLGYAGDARAATERTGVDSSSSIQLSLDRAVDRELAEREESRQWENRRERARELRASLDGTISTLARSRVAPVVALSYNDSAARRYAEKFCPDDTVRRFEECDADGGVALQSRSGTARVVGVAVDVRLVQGARSKWVTLFVRA